MFVSGDKLAVTLMWRGDLALPGRQGHRDLQLQDQFAMLKQIGYLPESVHAA
jgi:hypothetical protein